MHVIVPDRISREQAPHEFRETFLSTEHEKMHMIVYKGPCEDAGPGVTRKTPTRDKKCSRSRSSRKIVVPSIPRIMTWWSVPKVSSLACLGMSVLLQTFT